MFLVVGQTPVARRVCATLEQRGQVRHLIEPGDAELQDALHAPVRAAAVLERGDVKALRYALALAHIDPSLRQVVTVFDRTMSDQLQSFLPQATVFSPAAVSAPGIAGPALSDQLVWSCPEPDREVRVGRSSDGALVESHHPLSRAQWLPRALAVLRWDHRHHDAGTQLLVLGLLGLAAILLTDWVWLMLEGHHSVSGALLDAARVVATVGPGPAETSPGHALWSALAMLATIGLTAMFTAGMIDRLIEPRFLSMVGSKTVPRGGHVIVVGMGQLGVRLCEVLLDLGVPVVGVERDRSAPWLPTAQRLGVPVFVGDGKERQVLEKLRVGRCRALVAVGSDDLDNISVAVATAAVSPTTRVILRAGEQEAIAETRSLMPLGVIKDVTEIAAAFVLSSLLEESLSGAFDVDGQPFVRLSESRFEPALVSSRDGCLHE